VPPLTHPIFAALWTSTCVFGAPPAENANIFLGDNFKKTTTIQHLKQKMIEHSNQALQSNIMTKILPDQSSVEIKRRKTTITNCNPIYAP